MKRIAGTGDFVFDSCAAYASVALSDWKKKIMYSTYANVQMTNIQRSSITGERRLVRSRQSRAGHLRGTRTPDVPF